MRAMPGFGRSRGDRAHGGFDFAREPLLGLVEAGGKRVFVMDRGSPIGAECSLGLLRPKARFAGMSDVALAAAARSVCTSVDGRWRSRELRQSPPREFDIVAINRDTGVWRSREVYAAMLERRLASILSV